MSEFSFAFEQDGFFDEIVQILPIVYEGKRIGVIGMTGDPEIVKPIVRVASRTVVLWLKNHEQMNKQKVAAEEVYGQLQNMAATIEELAASDVQMNEQKANEQSIALQELAKYVEQVEKMMENLAQNS